jgi:hypothetical protein
MFDEESSTWKIPTITRRVVRAALYMGNRGEGDVTVAISLPRISICECCREAK